MCMCVYMCVCGCVCYVFLLLLHAATTGTGTCKACTNIMFEYQLIMKENRNLKLRLDTIPP